MSTFALDTSVAMAWYLPESFAESARAWQRQLLAGQTRLLVPSLHYWEVGNVLRTYVRRQELDEAMALDIFDLHLQCPLEAAEPPRRRVLEVALAYEATVYDAVFIALALEYQVPLLTAERTTRPWVVKLGPLVETVR